LRYAALLALLTVLGGGAGYAALEDTSTWNGVWWAVTTMTTVGYGDQYPGTTAGRIAGTSVMVVGIGFVALLTGVIAQRFLAPSIEYVERQVETVEEEVTMEERELLIEVREITARFNGSSGRSPVAAPSAPARSSSFGASTPGEARCRSARAHSADV
jgi:hypothetical protein